MSRIVYVNGAYLPEDKAKVSVFDRGFLFADAVYEVTCVLNGKLVAFRRPRGPSGTLPQGAEHTAASDTG